MPHSSTEKQQALRAYIQISIEYYNHNEYNGVGFSTDTATADISKKYSKRAEPHKTVWNRIGNISYSVFCIWYIVFCIFPQTHCCCAVLGLFLGYDEVPTCVHDVVVEVILVLQSAQVNN